MAATAKPAPVPTPETRPFWDATAAGRLALPRCVACDELLFPPRGFCPACLGDDVAWEELSGRGRLHTYLVSHRPAPGFGDEVPYVIAIVELDEGPRLMANIVEVATTTEQLVLDMPLEVVFEDQEGMAVPKFRPAAGRRP